MNPVIPLRKAASTLVVVAGFVSVAQAVNPPPDGGYPGGNTAEGQAALLSLTSGGFNTAVGWLALRSNTENGFNTAIGAGALLANISGTNTATGAGALLSSTTGGNNTANGAFALFSNITGQSNTATGAGALFSNATADNNTANGFQALFSNADGSDNTATGFHALFSNIEGNFNTATGSGALFSNTIGFRNTATGYQALFSHSDGDQNTANGYQALYYTTGFGNTALGALAGTGVTTAHNVIAIGTPGLNVSDSCFIGNIYGQMAGFGTAVYINSSGQLGTTNSSQRFKDDIKPTDKASEVLFALKPVTSRYKKELDPAGIAQFGLVAEDVEKVNPDLVLRDADGQVRTVRYEQINAMLLNEFLKEHKKVEEQAREIQQQKATISELTKGMETVVARLGEQDSKIRTVSEQVEIGKFATRRIDRDGPAPQMFLNNQ